MNNYYVFLLFKPNLSFSIGCRRFAVLFLVNVLTYFAVIKKFNVLPNYSLYQIERLRKKVFLL